MTAPRYTRPLEGRSRRRSLRLLALLVVLAAAIAAAVGAFYLFGRSTPGAVSLGSAPPAASSATAAADAASPTPADTTDGGAGATAGRSTSGGSFDGTWSVDPSIGSFSDFTSSFVGYRVQEELANVGAATAVGRTPNVTGTLEMDGTTITGTRITADLTTLQSDNSMRDGQLGRQALETDTYPTATFVLTQPIELGSLPAEGATISVTAIGDLTLHGTTRSVSIPLEGRRSSGVVTVVGQLPIAFADYGIESPRSMMVLSVDDHGVMELQLHFTRTS
jgi:polyisoprenoid-binding protein YceI